MWKAYEQAGIPFTLHRGKENDYLTKARVRRMYGDDVIERWLSDRRQLLSAAMRKTFSSRFLEDAGLAD